MPAFFLSREALGPFGALITRGEAALIDTGALVDAIRPPVFRHARLVGIWPPG